MKVATESKNIQTKIENVHAKLIVYGHYVCALVNHYFKLCQCVKTAFFCLQSRRCLNCNTVACEFS